MVTKRFEERRLRAPLAVLAMLLSMSAQADRMKLFTTAGEIEIDLLQDVAPLTVKHISEHARSGFYNGLIFHRLNPGFVVQTGGYEPDRTYREPAGTVANESVGGLLNTLGTVGLARHDDPDSGDVQFYFNLRDSKHLDALRKRPGYTVFGRVVSGWEIVEQISEMETTDGSWPVDPVLIENAVISRDPPETN